MAAVGIAGKGYQYLREMASPDEGTDMRVGRLAVVTATIARTADPEKAEPEVYFRLQPLPAGPTSRVARPGARA